MRLNSAQIHNIIRLVNKAANKVMEIYAQNSVQITEKADFTPVTAADLASNEILVSGLKNLFPTIPIVSEEENITQNITDKDTCWLVDPLDGTKEFLAKNGEFTINVALIVNKQPEFGVIAVPAEGIVVFAQRGEGLWEQSGGQIRKIAIPTSQEKTTARRLVCSRSHLNASSEDFMKKIPEVELLRRGAAIKYLMLSQKQADIYPRFGRTMEWDTAAGQIILEEAGGTIVQYSDGSPLTYMKPDFVNDSFVAYAAGIDKI